MKFYFLFSLALSALIFGLSACGSSDTILPASDLAQIPPSKILEFAHDKYSDGYYSSAVFYYSNIIINYTNWNDNDSLAWATYEIGYILYDENRYQEAFRFFDNVLGIKSISTAPQILASRMKDEVSSKLKNK